jgi:hypothetical protein
MIQQNFLSSHKPKSSNKYAISLFLLGLLFLICGYGMQQEQQYKEKNYTKTTGKVIEDFNYSYKPIATDLSSRTNYVYKIDFMANGKLFNFTDSYVEGLQDSFNVAKDRSVTVLYDPKNPANSPEAYRPHGITKWNFFMMGGTMIILSISIIACKPSATLV